MKKSQVELNLSYPKLLLKSKETNPLVYTGSDNL